MPQFVRQPISDPQTDAKRAAVQRIAAFASLAHAKDLQPHELASSPDCSLRNGSHTVQIALGCCSIYCWNRARKIPEYFPEKTSTLAVG